MLSDKYFSAYIGIQKGFHLNVHENVTFLIEKNHQFWFWYTEITELKTDMMDFGSVKIKKIIPCHCRLCIDIHPGLQLVLWVFVKPDCDL